MHGYTGYIGVYRVYSITRVNMGKQDIGMYRVNYTVLQGCSWVHRIYRGIRYYTNILGSLYGDCHELLAAGACMHNLSAILDSNWRGSLGQFYLLLPSP